MKNKKKTKMILILSSILIVLCMLVLEVKSKQNNLINRASEIEEDQNTKVKESNNSKYIDTALAKEIEAYLRDNDIDHEDISYCIKDLKHNITYSMNENEEFVAASTYKLPLAMLYYDMVNEGEYDLETTFTYSVYMHEDVGVISSSYGIGSQIPLKDILDFMILYSDNDAAHILYENLGGWKAYKQAMQKYTDAISENYYSIDNVTTAKTLNDVSSYLYKHKKDYKDLIKNMEKAELGEYLDKVIQQKMPQKYGMCNYTYNSVGFVDCETPYSIVVLTNLGEKGVDVMAEINNIVYSHFK